jgi:hypothetical protein
MSPFLSEYTLFSRVLGWVVGLASLEEFAGLVEGRVSRVAGRVLGLLLGRLLAGRVDGLTPVFLTPLARFLYILLVLASLVEGLFEATYPALLPAA